MASWPVVPPESMSGFMALQQQGSIITKGQAGMLMSEGRAELATSLTCTSQES